MNLKIRLALMNFLEFAVWGAYLTCMGNYLGAAGLGDPAPATVGSLPSCSRHLYVWLLVVG